MDNPLLGRLAGELSGTATDSATKTLSGAGEQIANAGGGGFSLDGGVKVSLGAELTGKRQGIELQSPNMHQQFYFDWIWREQSIHHQE